MLKSALTWLTAVAVLLLVVLAVIGGARSISVPIAQSDYQNCLQATEAQKNAHPNCKTSESLWDRGLADPIAYYTLWLTFFTLALATVGIVQGVFTKQQIALARDEFNATHRPDIIVHSVQFVFQQHGTENPAVCVGALIAFFNQGATNAVIKARTGIIGRFPTPLTFNINPGPIDGITNEVVRSGSPGHFFVDSNILVANAGANTFDNERVYCIGVIAYADESGNRRHTGFVRILNTDIPEDGGERWMRVGEENPYEYAY